jgi:uncharacterized membrane protein
MSTMLFSTTFAAVLGAGVVGGVFFAFSSFVMPGLERLPAAQGVAAMKEINVTAEHPAFMLAFMGTTVLCVYLGVRGMLDWGDTRATLLVAGSALYLVGTFLLTVAYNVPLNNELADVSPHATTPRSTGRSTSTSGTGPTICAGRRASRPPRRTWGPCSPERAAACRFDKAPACHWPASCTELLTRTIVAEDNYALSSSKAPLQSLAYSVKHDDDRIEVGVAATNAGLVHELGCDVDHRLVLQCREPGDKPDLLERQHRPEHL